jgi:O-antigen/teichoic acid export membrane protein
LFNTIVKTVFTKGISAVISFLIVIITAHVMGANGRGDISLFVLNITVVLLVSDLLGGGALVYLIPRYKLLNILAPAWIWGILCGIGGPLLFVLFMDNEEVYNLQTMALFVLSSIFLNLSSTTSVALNGKEKIRENNIVSFLQVFSLLFFLGLGIFVFHLTTPLIFYAALFLSYFISFLLSMYFLRTDLKAGPQLFSLSLIREMATKGFHVQSGNAIQLLNYRVALYLLYHFQNKAQVGIYATGASVCESVWVISNGISMVQYARIANMKDKDEAIELSAWLAKISFLLTVGALLILLCLPSVLFISIFGHDFPGLPHIILLLSGGIGLFGLTCMYAHYFSGLGKLQVGAFSSVVGFVVTLIAGFLLIPRFGISGAALTASASYTASSLFLIIRFKQDSRKSYAHLLLSYSGMFNFVRKLKANVRD